jgi:hypothetical protein
LSIEIGEKVEGFLVTLMRCKWSSSYTASVKMKMEISVFTKPRLVNISTTSLFTIFCQRVLFWGEKVIYGRPPADAFIKLTEKKQAYCCLKALLPIAKRRIPAPSKSKVTGQGRGQPNNGLGMPANIIMASRISMAPAIIKSHFDGANIVHLSFLHTCILFYGEYPAPGRANKSSARSWLGTFSVVSPRDSLLLMNRLID